MPSRIVADSSVFSNLPRSAVVLPTAWAALPTHAKVLHCLAQKAGLHVAHASALTVAIPEIADALKDMDATGWLWAWDEAAFRASGLFKPSQNWSFVDWSTATTGEGLRVDLLRSGGAMFAVHRQFAPIGRRSCERFAAMAAADKSFQAFKAATLVPVALDDQQAAP